MTARWQAAREHRPELRRPTKSIASTPYRLPTPRSSSASSAGLPALVPPLKRLAGDADDTREQPPGSLTAVGGMAMATSTTGPTSSPCGG
jgi:hypothetical protein